MKYISILLIFFWGCGSSEESSTDQADNVSQADSNNKRSYRTYKRESLMMNTGRKKLEKILDVEDAKHHILKTFDSHKSKIPSSSQ